MLTLREATRFDDDDAKTFSYVVSAAEPDETRASETVAVASAG